MKFTSIEEEQDAITINDDDLVCSLLTFEMTINEKFEKRYKSVAFKVDVEEYGIM